MVTFLHAVSPVPGLSASDQDTPLRLVSLGFTVLALHDGRQPLLPTPSNLGARQPVAGYVIFLTRQ